MKISILSIAISGFVAISVVALSAFALGKNSGTSLKDGPNIDIKYADATSNIAHRNLVGIWGVANERCASDFVIVYSADGRFASGDGREGIEGKWKIDGRIITHNRTIKYNIDDDELNMIINKNPNMYVYTIINLSENELTIDSDGEKFDLIKCHDGNYTFQDGGSFKEG
ncbi:hypothetical protein FJQ54_04010 [Sandaracinobacter neustonicus]|uniref:DUF5640 domain-containing protein n=1 Tax=Sandaracinobacter neustonicus TaxID=1715348 RepID=A0A501XT64_9SPHN|nr:hypothetical protein FJQ54_04010 [Sandaracinobacter neustonicus]